MRAVVRKRIIGISVVLVAVLMLMPGCTMSADVLNTAQRADKKTCGGKDCHADAVAARFAGPHAQVGCTDCHKDADKGHTSNPEKVNAAIEWRIEGCAPCHEAEAVTYLYDDNAQAGPFGGSTRVPEQPKVNTFPAYNEIVSGHGFTKAYNEEGAHSVLLEDHYKITRGKYETCVQCKSTKVALAWRDNKPITIEQDQVITLTHTADKTTGAPAKTVTVTAGTIASFSTDKKTREAKVSVTFPDGKKVTSPPDPSQDATAAFNTTWATAIAATMDTWPYGAGCNHCHDPHSTKMRLVRGAMIDAIAEKDTVNPYDPTAAKDFDSAAKSDQRNLVCGQCHVEYTCGKSGVDGKDRDVFGWSSAADLNQRYTDLFDYTQDWKHKLIGQPLIKSQHPELETFWASAHEVAGVSCGDCHMPEVRTDDGRTIRSHWFTSPYKYRDAALFSRFASATPVSAAGPSNPCVRCHEDRTARAIEQQTAVFEQQKAVQAGLLTSVNNLAAIKAKTDAGAKIDSAVYGEALDAHRKAHVLWENLIVSENSMGFHDYEEVMAAMADAGGLLTKALAAETKLLK